MKTWNYLRTNEDQDYSESEEINFQITKMKKENPNDPALKDLYEDYDIAIQGENEEMYGSSIVHEMKKARYNNKKI